MEVSIIFVYQIDQETLKFVFLSLQVFKKRPHKIIRECFHLLIFLVLKNFTLACTIASNLWPPAIAINEQVFFQCFFLHVSPRFLYFLIHCVSLHHSCHLCIHMVQMCPLILVSMIGQQCFSRLPGQGTCLVPSGHIHIVQKGHVATRAKELDLI